MSERANMSRTYQIVCGKNGDGGNEDRRNFPVTVLTTGEAESDSLLLEKVIPSVRRIRETHFCKLEVYDGFMYGTVSIPENGERGQIRFAFIVFKDQVVFVDDTGHVIRLLDKMKEKTVRKNNGIGIFLADFFDALIAEDLLMLTAIEDQIAMMEDQVLEESLEGFNHRITASRRRIMLYAHYYLQLSDVCSSLIDDELGFFSTESEHAIRLVGERIDRLYHETMMLREYCTQGREVYLSQIDIGQNRIMKGLTIVTTIFLTLTLIVGWYGMNFKYMPELEWRYGYPVVIVLCAAIVILGIMLFKRKKYF